MKDRFQQLAQRVKSLREKVQALESQLPSLTEYLETVLGEMALIESQLVELTGDEEE